MVSPYRPGQLLRGEDIKLIDDIDAHSSDVGMRVIGGYLKICPNDSIKERMKALLPQVEQHDLKERIATVIS